MNKWTHELVVEFLITYIKMSLLFRITVNIRDEWLGYNSVDIDEYSYSPYNICQHSV
jgi:hypothetical protein